MPLVSVIMSVLDTPLEYLTEAVESILCQTYGNIEFIIIDDGSVEGEVIEYLDHINDEKSNVKVIRNKQNIGLTKSLNIAIDNCHGEYIARMDADDISLPDRIEKQVVYMECNPDVCMTGTAVMGFSGDKVLFDSSKSTDHLANQYVREIRLVFENTGYAHPTFMLRRSFLDNHCIRYREDLKKAQDYALTTDCILAGGKRHLINEPLFKYRIHSGQISSKSYSEQVECQAITAHRRISATFKSLSDDECWILARLNHERQDYTPLQHVNAIKKIVAENRVKKLYDDKLFKKEFYYEWYRKIMRISRINKRPWGMFCLFNLRIIPAVISIKMENYLN